MDTSGPLDFDQPGEGTAQFDDDGWPTSLIKIAFAEDGSHAFKSILNAIGTDTAGIKMVRHASRLWQSRERRPCQIKLVTDASVARFGGLENVPEDYVEQADTSTECAHFFHQENLKMYLKTGATKCPVCKRELHFCPFPARYLENPKRARKVLQPVPSSQNKGAKRGGRGGLRKRAKDQRRAERDAHWNGILAVSE
ncbi:hypothetical protein EXIGLDRAFT_760008 [Exidia glandulosa HHB12029]|uniref:Uncharacterized protein n=1 Tax=Exidia glandulosa HHB12029 TaxID=1314781 RepID=A0A165PGS2_EXIGL|nr:hypothetical protein EXIGLDRAFT_760008 [Exidia glandulosa HHB12029]